MSFMKKKFRYEIEKLSFINRREKRYVLIEGWCYKKDYSSLLYSVTVNNKNCNFFIDHIYRGDIASNILDIKDNKIGFRVIVLLEGEINSFKFIVSSREDSINLIDMNEDQIKDIEEIRSIDYLIENYKYNDKSKIYTLDGWAVSDISSVTPIIKDSEGNLILHSIQMINRYELEMYGLIKKEQSLCGFKIDFPADINKKYFVEFQDKETNISVPLILEPNTGLAITKAYFSSLNMSNLMKAYVYFRKYGFSRFVERLKMGPNGNKFRYQDWFNEHKATEEELQLQRETVFDYQPKISIIVATFNTDEVYLKEMIGTVLEQTYLNWELCIGDGSTNSFVEEYVKDNYKFEPRIKYKKLEKNYGISGNMNGALSIASGDYVALYDHDDLLTPDALFEVVKVLQEYPYDVIYTDEDKLDNDRKELMDPYLKPDFSIDLLRSQNYICHFLIVNKKIVDDVGGLHAEFDGSQDLDYVLRCSERANAVYHIPKVLYHWRMHPSSTAQNPESKLYCYDAGARAVQAHLDRMGEKGIVEKMPKPFYGMYRTKYVMNDSPLVSIVVIKKSEKDCINDLIDSLLNTNNYKNIEVIVINCTKLEDVPISDKVHVYQWNDEINYSKIYNYAISLTHGEYALILRESMKIIDENSIYEMLSCCTRNDVSIVSGKVLGLDNTILHAGIIFENDGTLKLPFVGQDNMSFGYYCHSLVNCNYSAVSSMCMMIKKSDFVQLGSFNEDYSVSMFDIDFCCRVRLLNKTIVYNAFSTWLYNPDDLILGYEISKEDIELFNSEYLKFREKNREFLSQGDPFYSPNFDSKKDAFML